jgi:uncharacterized cupin superfamily protein
MTTTVGRLVTRLGRDGHATVHSAGELSVTKWRGADAGDAVVWSTATVPADNSDAELDTAGKDIGTTINGGTVFRVTELGTGFRSPMHRTLSCDYLIVRTGELQIIFESGETLDLRPGDTVIQRGTAHAWRNPSQQERCTFAVAMIEANPVHVGSRTFGATPTWRMLASALRTVLPRGLGGPPVAGGTADSLRRAPRRIVTGHDPRGKAVVRSAGPIPAGVTNAGVTTSTIWTTPAVPIDNSGDEPEVAASRTGAFRGSDFRILELAPGVTTPPDQSSSVDYCLVLSGAVELILDSATTPPLGQGETVVQRGTTHSWLNPDPVTPSRIMICRVEAKPVPAALGAPIRPHR